MRFFQQALLNKFVCLTLVFSSVVLSKEVNLIKVSNESDTDTMVIGASITNENFINSLYIDYFHKNESFAFKRLTIKNDLAGKKVKVYTRKKRDIIVLESSDFNPYRGGEIVINYLYNAITGSMKRLKLELDMKNSWHLYVKDEEVESIHLNSKRAFLIGEIGIENIVIKYKEGKK